MEDTTIGLNMIGSTTPESLLEHLRQYQHNRPTGELFAGFDYKGTVGLVDRLEHKIKKLEAEKVGLGIMVDEQAEDDGLWFQAETAPEAYLQQELRKLHALIEGDSDD